MGWTPMEQEGQEELIDSLGKDLSAILFCPVRYCETHYSKNIFECKHSIPFPKYMVQICQETGEWHEIIQRHKDAVGNG